MRKPKIDPSIFWPAVLIIGAVLMLLFINPEAGRQTIGNVLSGITHNFDWLIEWFTFGGFIWLMYLACSKYGDIKLGGPDDKPEFSTFSWISIMITSGSGFALMYWAAVEPIYYLSSPPFGLEPDSVAAAQWGIAYGIFHWGFSAWGLFCIPAVAIAYGYHVRKIPSLKPSIACAGVLGKHADGWVGKAIDIIILLGTVGGMGTSLGVCVPLMSACFTELFGIQPSIYLDSAVIIIWVAIFGTTAYLGLQKGIKILSDWNVYGIIVLLVFMLVIGPTSFLLSYYFQSVGLMLQNFIGMSTYTAPILKSGFPQDWTAFYWAWWVVWAIYMGLFIARVSKGRTIRQMIIGAIICPTIGTSMFYLVLGGSVVDLHLSDGVNLISMLKENGAPFVIIQLLKSYPLIGIILPLFILIGFVYQATSFQGAAYTLASMATAELKNDEEPAPWHRLFWALVLGVLGFVMIIIGGLKVVQLSSVILAVPVYIILGIMIISVIKWIREDFGTTLSSPKMIYDIDKKEVTSEK